MPRAGVGDRLNQAGFLSDFPLVFARHFAQHPLQWRRQAMNPGGRPPASACRKKTNRQLANSRIRSARRSRSGSIQESARRFFTYCLNRQHIVFRFGNCPIAVMMPIDGQNRVNLSLRENISCFIYFRRVNHTANTSSHVTFEYGVLPKEIHQQECVDGRPQ